MTAVPLHCPYCAGLFQIDLAYAGQDVVCPLCQATISTPTAESLQGTNVQPPVPLPIPHDEPAPTEDQRQPDRGAETNPAVPAERAGQVRQPVDEPLLPPVANDPLAPAVSSEPPGGVVQADEASANDALLPPASNAKQGNPADNVSETPLSPAEQHDSPIEQQGTVPDQPAAEAPEQAPIVIRTEDGEISLREPVKKARVGHVERPLRRRSPQDRARRKLINNLLVWAICAVILLATILILLYGI